MPRKKSIFNDKALTELMGIPDVDVTIRAHLPLLIQRMFDLAEGVVMQEVRIEGEETTTRIYQLAPDRLALQFLIENVIGKTPQRVELTGKDGGPVEVIPWAPLAHMEVAGLLPEGGQVVEGVYSVIADEKGGPDGKTPDA